MLAVSVLFTQAAISENETSAQSIIEQLLPAADCQPGNDEPITAENGLSKLPELDLSELEKNDCSRGISVRKRTIDLTVEFDFNSSAITPIGKVQLDQLARAFSSKELSSYDFKLVGHTDAKGSEQYNQELSLRRVESVRTYLVSAHHLEANRLTLEGKGETQLKRINEPYSSENRRVEVINLGAKR